MTDLIDTTEMYLRTIYELEEEGITPLRARIAERLGHSGPTVSQTVARMERDGLLRVSDDRHLELSDHGRLLATRVMRKHRLAERLLVDVIGLEWEYAHDEACRWEHVMSEKVERKILRLIGDGTDSPYGNPIPGLDELGIEAPADDSATLQPLLDAAQPEGVVVTVRRIGEPLQVDPESLALLTRAGIVPGAHVLLRRDAAGVVVAPPGGAGGAAVPLPDDVAVQVLCVASGEGGDAGPTGAVSAGGEAFEAPEANGATRIS